MDPVKYGLAVYNAQTMVGYLGEDNVERKGQVYDSEPKDLTTYSQAYVFPNPASDILNIQLPNDYLGDFELQLFDVSGRLMMTKRYYTNKNQTNQLDLSQLGSGIYMYKLTWDINKQSGKVIKL